MPILQAQLLRESTAYRKIIYYITIQTNGRSDFDDLLIGKSAGVDHKTQMID